MPKTLPRGVRQLPLLVALPPENLSNPIGKVFKAFRGGEADSIATFYRVMTE